MSFSVVLLGEHSLNLGRDAFILPAKCLLRFPLQHVERNGVLREAVRAEAWGRCAERCLEEPSSSSTAEN